MSRYLFASALAFLCALPGGSQTSAQPARTDPVAEIVDSIVQPWIAQENLPGVEVGISLLGKRSFYCYGTRDDSGNPFRPDTIVEIGSCTKVFTTTLLAEQVIRGELSLDNPAQKYSPPGEHLQPSARAMRLAMLATHTAGLPDDPPGLPRRLEMRSIRHYTTKDFFRFISNWQPDGPLPAPYSYSNAGVGLLGYLVADAANEEWPRLVADRITGPLQMLDTSIRPTREKRARLSQGHRLNGEPAPEWPVFAWYAAGALRSTPEDMLKFGEANLGHKTVGTTSVPQQLTAGMKLAQQPRFPIDNGSLQALGWAVRPQSPGRDLMIRKNGGTDGFSSVIVLCPPKDAVVFVVTNESKAEATKIGIEIAGHLKRNAN